MNEKLRLEEPVSFSSDGPVKREVHRGKDFNVLVINLDAGQEIPIHYESYNVFFFVVFGRGRGSPSTGKSLISAQARWRTPLLVSEVL